MTARTVIRTYESIPDTRLPTIVKGEFAQSWAADTIIVGPRPSFAPALTVPAFRRGDWDAPTRIVTRPAARPGTALDATTIIMGETTRVLPDEAAAPRRVPLPSGFEVFRYQIDAPIGEGGFAITYRAKDLSLERQVAVKELFLGSYCTRGDAHEIRPVDEQDAAKAFRWASYYFSKEAKITAEMRHDNIVRLNDFFKTNGTAYIVYEMLNGYDLHKYSTTRSHNFTHGEAVDLFRVCADALLYVHERGFVHRDIKPSNVFIDARTKRPILIDFGAASEIGFSDSNELTAVSDGFSPMELYMPGARVDYRSDIYSLCATMYWALTGTRPPLATTRFSHDALIPLRKALAQDFKVGERLQRVITTGLNIQPEQRYPDIETLLEDLFPKVRLASSGYEALPRGEKVFLSYRREDSEHFSGRLLDYLEMRFGSGSVFFDVESIPAGIDFWDHIKSNLQRCAVLVVVMGPKWLEILKAKRRRWYSLGRQNDFVAAEIRAAIEMQLPILPVLFDGAMMPKQNELPKGMRRLVGLNAAIVGNGKQFRQGADAVCDQITTIKASLRVPVRT